MDTFASDIWLLIADNVPRLVLALAVLVAGWIVAMIGAAITRAILNRTSVDNKVANWAAGGQKQPPVEAMAGKLVFWVLMVFTFVAFLSVLNLDTVASPLSGFLNEIFAFLPNLLSAAVLLTVAWLVAKGLRFAVTRLLGATRIDERFGAEVGDDTPPPSQALGETVYWLVFLFFLPAVLGVLGLEGLLEPVNELLVKLVAFLPNLFAAALILGLGWLLARVIQRIVASVLSASGADALGERVGMGKVFGEKQLSVLVGMIVYIFILVPVVIAALEALQLDALTAPASGMLDNILAAVPQIFGAAVILFVAYLVGRLASELVTQLLATAGFDGFLQRIGFSKAEGEGTKTPSQIVGWIVLVAVMLFATIEAFDMLTFHNVAEIVATFTVFAGNVLLGVVIMAVGFYFANLAGGAIRSSGTTNAGILATGARAAILVLAGAMALRQAGLAEEIIELAFGLLLGAVAVATAIAFGLGGRDLAARRLEKWTDGGSGEGDSEE
jgi:hypothetical protein